MPFNWYGSLIFMNICKQSKETGLKLKLGNVSPYWFYAKDAPNLDGTLSKKEGVGEAVVSLVGLDPIDMKIDMPNLERITVPSTCFCVTGGGKRPEWPKLKVMDITVNGTVGTCWDYVGVTIVNDVKGNYGQRTDNAFAFLFCNIVRPSVEEMHLKFVEDDGKANSGSVVPKPLEMEKFLKGKDQVR